VQLQAGTIAKKRIKVWEAVDLWASLYRKKALDGERLLEQLGLSDKRNAWFMNLSGVKSSGCLLPCADQRSRGGVLDELTTGLTRRRAAQSGNWCAGFASAARQFF